jgi:hypothetical protein
MNIVYGLLGITAAYLLVRYRKAVIGFTGQWSFAEKVFGPGHTDLALLLTALFIFFFSVAVLTGHMDAFLDTSIGDRADQQNEAGREQIFGD